MNICVYGAASSEIDKIYTDMGEELGRRMAERGHSLIFGGGRNGMMGATARGVREKDGDVLGISPAFFVENNAEVSFPDCTEFIHTDTMRERKRLLEEKSDAFIITPGGIGTFDEFFEILTLKQLGRHNKAIVILNINGFYNELAMALFEMIKGRFITEDCVELCYVCESIDEALNYIESYDPKEIDLSKVKIR